MTVVPFPPDPTDWVAAAPFRAHLLHLCRTTGLPAEVVALQAEVSPRLVRRLVHGRRGRPLRRLPRPEAERLLALDRHQLLALDGTLVAGEPTCRRLGELIEAGVPPRTLAAACGVGVAAVVSLAEAADAPGPVPALLALRIRAVESRVHRARALAAA